MRPRVEASAGSLVVFTVLAQAAAGVSVFGGLARGELPPRVVPTLALVLLALGSLVALLHLGRPGRTRFAASNLRGSGLSREVLMGTVYALILVLQLAFPDGVPFEVLAFGAALTGILFVHAISEVYRLRTVPAWNSWATHGAFLGTMLTLGASAHAVLLTVFDKAAHAGSMSLIAAAAACVQLLVLGVHLWQMEHVGGVAKASAGIVHTQRRGLLVARIATGLLGAGLLLVSAGAQPQEAGLELVAAGTALLLASELMGRVLFYASHRRVGL